MYKRQLAKQTDDSGLQTKFAKVASELEAKQETILSELNSAQGSPMDIGGYYWPDPKRAEKAMRPSATLNQVVSNI